MHCTRRREREFCFTFLLLCSIGAGEAPFHAQPAYFAFNTTLAHGTHMKKVKREKRRNINQQQQHRT